MQCNAVHFTIIIQDGINILPALTTHAGISEEAMILEKVEMVSGACVQ